MHLALIAYLAIATINFAIGTYVLFKNPRNSIHRAFFLFTLGIAGWAVMIVLFAITERFLFVTLIVWSGELIIAGLILFAEALSPVKSGKWSFLIMLAPLVVFFFLTPSLFSKATWGP